jgi:hypothetical protein
MTADDAPNAFPALSENGDGPKQCLRCSGFQHGSPCYVIRGGCLAPSENSLAARTGCPDASQPAQDASRPRWALP